MADINGTQFNEALVGTALADTIDGLGGSDTLTGLGGNDTINGDTDGGVLPPNPPHVPGNDILDGGAGNDILNGDGGNDSLLGGTGNDFLNGGTGIDTMDGGTENDTYIVDNVFDITAEAIGGAAGGVDTVNSSVTRTLSVNLENLNLTGGAAINGTGNASNNVINGNGANNSLFGLAGNDALRGLGGNDFLRGGPGVDFLNGGIGADNMDGGTENDTYIVDNGFDIAAEAVGGAAGGVDTVNASVSHGLSVNLENLNLTGGAAINGAGNASNNVINGNGANNVLSGLGGNDTINGAGGNDTINGGAGTDNMTGGPGNDSFVFTSIGDSVPGAAHDVIADFAGLGIFAGDSINVSGIDANPFLALDQSFAFVGAAAFSAVGQLRYAGGLLQANTDFDFAAEFEVSLTGAPAVTVFDLTL